MKKILLLGLVLVLSIGSYASHIMGGELVVKHDTLDQHTITLRLFRDGGGISAPGSASITIYDTVNGTSQTLGLIGISAGFLPSNAYSIEVVEYAGSINLNNGHYSFTWSSCCRNNAILNAASPGSQSITLTANLWVDGVGNSTPDFGALPAMVVPADTVWYHNPVPFDVNGDSLAWRLDTPLAGHSGGVNTYVSGYTAPPSDTTGVFTIDPITGTITWDPAAVGNYIAAVLVDEFKNGIHIGTVRREYQFIVVPDSSFLRISNLNQLSTNINGHYEMAVNSLSNINFSLRAENPNGNVSIAVYGEAVNLTTNPATVNVTDSGAVSIANLDWTPLASQARQKPYQVIYRISDDNFDFDFSILYRVNESTIGIMESSDLAVNLFPNPTTESFNIKMLQPIKLVQVYDLNGKLVFSQAGNRQNEMQLNAPSTAGTYLVKVYHATGTQTVKLAVN